MNKYEEALKELLANADYVINTSDKKFTLSFDTLRGLGVRNSLMAQRLQELVKRATPMKPIKDAFDCYKCPNCGEFKLECSFDNYGYCDTRLDYCPECGQSLDWSDK